MKKIILSIVFLLAFLQINAQNFSLFEMDSVRWKVYYNEAQMKPPDIQGYFYDILHQDTLINGVSWKKVYRSNDTNHVNSNVNAYIHIDGSKIYAKNNRAHTFCNTIDTSTYLLFDYSLNIGDSILIKTTPISTIFCDSQWLPMYVTNIDTINMLGNRRRFELTPGTVPNYYAGLPIYWYEGIGTNKSIFYNEFLISDGFTEFGMLHKLCAIDTNETRILDLGCVFLSNSTKFDPKISFNPNPAINKLIIENQEVKDFNLQVLDLNGKLLMENQIVGSYEEIDVNSLKNGVYILRIEQEDKVLNKKLVIQRD